MQEWLDANPELCLIFWCVVLVVYRIFEVCARRGGANDRAGGE